MTRDIIRNYRAIVFLFLLLVLAVFSFHSALGAEKPKKEGKQQASTTDKSAEEAPLRFTDNADGTVLDTHTDILWPKDADLANLPLSWQAAQQFIQEMNNGERPNLGYTDWRLPTINELETLVDEKKFYPAIPDFHPFENVQNHFYWSSSRGVDIFEYVWILDMASGNKVIDYVSACNYRYVWPVRTSWAFEGAKSGVVLAGGLNAHGQLGDGSTQDRIALLPVQGLTDAMQVEAGMEHGVAINLDGTVWTWGRNMEGQLGTGTTMDSKIPVMIKEMWKVVDIAAGQYHTAALKSDGTVWTWGRNSDGQLGNGTVKDSLLPVQVRDLTDVANVEAGMYHTIAVKKDGTLWAWGRNLYGQLGDGTTENKHVPVQVQKLADVKDMAAGLHHTVALLSDGTVWAWGWNANGLLGDGTKEDKHTPVRVKGLSRIVDVAVGLHHNIALKSDGIVWAWGTNEYGQLGTSTTVKFSAALMVEGIQNVRKVSAAMYHSAALLSDGTIWVWGKDLKNRIEKSLPVEIRDTSRIVSVSAGKYFTLAIQASAKEQKE
jgi:alpha-tubulin suppressor-like RCC1 family protein